MGEFKHYPKIELWTHEKTLKSFCVNNPDFENEEFVIQEKIHGSNIQIIFESGKDPVIGSRNRFLTGDRNHSNIKSILNDPEVKKEYEELFTSFQQKADILQKKITIFGEWFGSGICKGINYGKTKRYILFDIAIDNRILPQTEIMSEFYNQYISDYFVRQYPNALNLQEALDFNTDLPSLYSPTGDQCEGVVIKPFSKIYLDHEGNPFFIKKKNKKFLEKSRAPKEIRDPKELIPDLDILEPYVNDNRIQSVFSKEGKITNKRQIGDYIKLVQVDIIEDFEAEKPDYELHKDQKRYIAKRIVQHLQKYL